MKAQIAIAAVLVAAGTSFGGTILFTPTTSTSVIAGTDVKFDVAVNSSDVFNGVDVTMGTNEAANDLTWAWNLPAGGIYTDGNGDPQAWDFKFTAKTLNKSGLAKEIYVSGAIINPGFYAPANWLLGTLTVRTTGLAAGTYNVVVNSATDGSATGKDGVVDPLNGSTTFTVVPAPGSPVIAAIPDATISAPNAYTGPTPVLTQGTSPITWTLEAGPADMTIDSSTGVVSWPTSTTAGSPHTITIKATNADGNAAQSWQLTVTPAVSPIIAAIPDASIQAPNAYTGPTPSLTQGTPVVTWSLVANPPGMTIDSSTGVVSWAAPDSTGSPYTITIKATNTEGDSTQSWQLTVTPAPIIPVIAPMSDDSVIEPNPYTGPRPVLTQGTLPVTWSLVAGPTNMGIDSTTGKASWAASTATGSPFTVTIKATNAAGSATQTFHVSVSPAIAPVIAAIADAAIREPATYNGPVPSLTQGTGPVMWSLVEGPDLMGIWPDTGQVFWGTSTVTGSPFTITIKASNFAGSATQTWHLTVTEVPVIPIIAAIPDASVVTPNAYTGPTPSLVQGTLPITWSLLSGPSGMTISSTTGVLSWPVSRTAGSPFTITIQATNDAGSSIQTWHLTASSPASPAIAAIPDDSVQASNAYTGPTPSLTEGTQPVTWSLVAGPSGMTIDSATGVVSWPASSAEGSPWTITIEATNSAGNAVQSWNLAITSNVKPPIPPGCGNGGSENLPAVGMICLLSLMASRRFVGSRCARFSRRL